MLICQTLDAFVFLSHAFPLSAEGIDLSVGFLYNVGMSDEISKDVRESVLAALIVYYKGGCELKAAFKAADGIGYGSYYRLKKVHPDEMRLIDHEARQAAILDRDGAQIAYDSEQLELSRQLQKESAEAMLDALPQIAHLAKGGTLMVKKTNKAGEEENKLIVIYPRDQLQAMNVLQILAKSGVVPDDLLSPPPKFVGEEEETQVLALPLPVNANFSRIEATRPDGTVITATVERPEIIDVEPVDVSG